MKKIKIPKQTKEQRAKKVKERLQKQRLAIIEAKYNVKIEKTLKLYHDKTMGELWTALDILKEQMAVELAEIGIK